MPLVPLYHLRNLNHCYVILTNVMLLRYCCYMYHCYDSCTTLMLLVPFLYYVYNSFVTSTIVMLIVLLCYLYHCFTTSTAVLLLIQWLCYLCHCYGTFFCVISLVPRLFSDRTCWRLVLKPIRNKILITTKIILIIYTSYVSQETKLYVSTL